MSTPYDRFEDADSILRRVLDSEDSERGDLLNELCGDDSDLRQKVETLLAQVREKGTLDPVLPLQMASEPAPRIDMIGTSLSHYEITAKLGEGGMGEVYRAKDTKLGRDVAIKVLPTSVAGDRERLSRFEREARVLATLNHPNIAQVHGFDEDDGLHFLVMELAEGESLAERIRRGPIPIDEAIPIALQICEALEAAHERGIVHRDLKPANVHVSAERSLASKVKVLDFGLAKALAPASTSEPELTSSPTLTQQTAAGVLLGTAAYMSPEQARGQEADTRSDIWAFGCVLYEMLTGKRPFEGNTVSDVLAAVLKDEPDFRRLSQLPEPLSKVLRRCLRKQPRSRLQAIGDARLELEESSEEPDQSVFGAEPGSSRRPLAWVLPLLLGGVIGATALSWLQPKPVAEAESIIRFSLELPPNERLRSTSERKVLGLSADGETLAYAGQNLEGDFRLFTRRLDELESRSWQVTAGPFAVPVVLSPDGEAATFSRDGVLFRASTRGGIPVPIGKAGRLFSGAWLSDGALLLEGGDPGRLILSDSGGEGTIVSLQSPDLENFVDVMFPSELQGGRTVLLNVRQSKQDPFDAAVLDLESGNLRTLIPEAVHPSYIDGGFLVYGRGNTLFAARFDLDSLELAGPAQPVLTGVARETAWKRIPLFAVSRTGTLVYVPEGQRLGQNRLAWLSEDGTLEPMALEEGAYSNPSLSPDGRTIALTVRRAGGGMVLAAYDTRREVLSELSSAGSFNSFSTWHPDGSKLAFTSDSGGPYSIQLVSPDGQPLGQLQESPANQQPGSWSPDGRFFAYLNAMPTGGGGNLWVRSLASQSQPLPLSTTPEHAATATFSPEGRAIAYLEVRNGRAEIVVTEFDPSATTTGRTLQASNQGGVEPVWARDGRRLFYRTLDGLRIMSVSVAASANGLVLGNAQTVVETPTLPPPLLFTQRSYDVAADGRFLIVDSTPRDRPTRVVVVRNWLREWRNQLD